MLVVTYNPIKRFQKFTLIPFFLLCFTGPLWFFLSFFIDISFKSVCDNVCVTITHVNVVGTIIKEFNKNWRKKQWIHTECTPHFKANGMIFEELTFPKFTIFSLLSSTIMTCEIAIRIYYEYEIIYLYCNV